MMTAEEEEELFRKMELVEEEVEVVVVEVFRKMELAEEAVVEVFRKMELVEEEVEVVVVEVFQKMELAEEAVAARLLKPLLLGFEKALRPKLPADPSSPLLKQRSFEFGRDELGAAAIVAASLHEVGLLRSRNRPASRRTTGTRREGC